MKRRGFLAALAALPLTPFAVKANAAPQIGNMRIVGARIAELEVMNIRGINAGCIPSSLLDDAPVADWMGDGHGKLPATASASKMVNRHALILQAAHGPVRSIKAYDGHAPLTFDRDYATGEELRAATGKPGRYATCLAEGLWRPFGAFSGKPAFVWGAEVA